MTQRSYLKGQWAVYENRAANINLGYVIDGIGMPALPGEKAFSIIDDYLVDPSGVHLGKLIPLGDAWAVDLGNQIVGQILRAESN
ncbi:hypothetical protein [Aquipseudomonas campi]